MCAFCQHALEQNVADEREDAVILSRTCFAVSTAVLALYFCSSLKTQELATAVKPVMELQTQTSGPIAKPAPNTAASEDHVWHVDLTPYLWFAGAHGTVGARGRNVSIHATPGDLLSHLDIGLMGAAEARYKHFLLAGDILWIRLSDSKALPFPALSAISADARVGEFVWTSKVAYRVVDHKIKADANVGVRYWHLGQKLSFNPSLLGISFNGSQNWADIVIGGRVQLPLGEKTVVDLLGDVGGWGAAAQLDYQFAALVAYKISSRWKLGAGYRYLFIDYRTGPAVFNMVTAGPALGATYTFK